MQTGLLVCPQIVGDVDNHSGHASTDAGLVGRKPDVGKKNFAIATRAMALHDRAKGMALAMSRRKIEQGREVAVDGRALKVSCGYGEELVSSFIREEEAAIGVGGKDRGRAAFNEHLELFFGILTRCNLVLYLKHVLAGSTSAAHDTVDEEPKPAKCGKGKNIARDTDGRSPLQAVVGLGQAGAKSGHNTDLPSIQDPADEQHG